MMTTFASTRPSPLSTVEGPPVAGTGSAAAGASIIAMLMPPKGFVGSVIDGILSRFAYPLGVSSPRSREGVEGRQDVPPDGLEVGRLVHVLELDDDVLGAGIGELGEAVDGLRRRLRPAAP